MVWKYQWETVETTKIVIVLNTIKNDKIKKKLACNLKNFDW